jgi:predicted secreted protein
MGNPMGLDLLPAPPRNDDRSLLGDTTYNSWQQQMQEAKDRGDKDWYGRLQKLYQADLSQAKKQKELDSQFDSIQQQLMGQHQQESHPLTKFLNSISSLVGSAYHGR